jgi:dipeptidyl-peptidase-4
LLLSVDPEQGEIAFSARPDPTQWKVYTTTLDSSAPRELTSEAGCHTAAFDKHHTVYVDTASTLKTMPRTHVFRRGGTNLGELPSVAEEPPSVPKVELAKVGPDAGFYTAIVRPRDFDVNVKYPVIVHVYGGPLNDWSSGTVIASMSSWLLPQWIADQGFVVVSIDGRGTPGRGHDWERAIAKHFGSVPLQDQVDGLIELVKQHPEMDLSRVAIYGWSFGGYMSALAVLKEPGIFKAAVAGAPPTDWTDYDTHYTERYLGIPPADAAAYDEGSLLKLATGLRRPLLLIHGTGDDNVYFRHSLRLIDALFRAGRSCEVLPLSGLTHMVPDSVVNEQLYSRMVRFFKANLEKP